MTRLGFIIKVAVGYRLPSSDAESIVDIILDYTDVIAEVYFPWVGSSSGRAALGVTGEVLTGLLSRHGSVILPNSGKWVRDLIFSLIRTATGAELFQNIFRMKSVQYLIIWK